jgi:hypothetical protein
LRGRKRGIVSGRENTEDEERGAQGIATQPDAPHWRGAVEWIRGSARAKREPELKRWVYVQVLSPVLEGSALIFRHTEVKAVDEASAYHYGYRHFEVVEGNARMLRDYVVEVGR